MLYQKNITINKQYDVIIAGGGPSGCAAAAACARHGAKTLLLETGGCLGGMGTVGMVPFWCPFGDPDEFMFGGIAKDVFLKATAPIRHLDHKNLSWVPIDAEILKRVYDDLVTSAGADILFGSTVVDTASEAGGISYLLVSNKAGLTGYRAKIYIDCTGDADIAAQAGVGFELGEPGTHETQPATLCFLLANVDDYGYRFPRRVKSIAELRASGKYSEHLDDHLCYKQVGPSLVGCNCGHFWNINPLDPSSVSSALIAGRKVAAEYLDYFKEYCPDAFQNAHLAATSPVLGTRESRRINGDYTLTAEDYLQRRKFPDQIAMNNYYIDLHVSKEERELQKQGKFDFEKRKIPYKPKECYGIPYRCLLPAGVDNLLVAGKTVSADRYIQSSIRVMPVCLAMGQAAGTAAALLALSNKATRQMDTELLKTTLLGDGVVLVDAT